MSMSTDEEIQTGLKILSIIELAVDEWKKLKTGAVKPQDVLDKLNVFTASISTNDKAADNAVDAKFPK